MRHGFYWGGHYPTRYDTMHFEFMDSLASIAAHTANASREAGDPTPPQPNPPQACATLRSYPPIGQGARGTAVTVAQCQLKAARHAIVVDGVFGAQTKAEVVAYQRARGSRCRWPDRPAHLDFAAGAGRHAGAAGGLTR